MRGNSSYRQKNIHWAPWSLQELMGSHIGVKLSAFSFSDFGLAAVPEKPEPPAPKITPEVC